ncbi:MAG: hypothetical protein NSGCLCUN01_01986 [uncultured Clostridium sp.]
MNSNGQLINNVFNDKNINKDERYMFLMFLSMINDIKDEIAISINTLMEAFQTKGKKKLLDILKSLENKGYIKIVKNMGKTNKYRIIKNYDCDCVSKSGHGTEDCCNDESCHSEQAYNLNITSSYIETGSEISSSYLGTGTEISCGDLDTSSEITSSYIYQEDKKTNCNLNNNKINNNKLYINIFNTWNDTNINNEKILYPSVKSAIEYAINLYGEEKVITAIKNYSEVYYSDYYYDFTWNLISFLRKPNAIKRFLDNGDMWRNYRRKLEKEKDEEKFKINIEDYIY